MRGRGGGVHPGLRATGRGSTRIYRQRPSTTQAKKYEYPEKRFATGTRHGTKYQY